MRKTSKITLSIAAGFCLSLVTPVSLARFSDHPCSFSSIEPALADKPEETSLPSTTDTPCPDLQKCFQQLKDSYNTFSTKLDAYLLALERLVQDPKTSPDPPPQHKGLHDALLDIKKDSQQLRKQLPQVKNSTQTTDLTDILDQVDGIITGIDTKVLTRLLNGGVNNRAEVGRVQADLKLAPNDLGQYDRETFEAIRSFFDEQNPNLAEKLDQLERQIPRSSQSNSQSQATQQEQGTQKSTQQGQGSLLNLRSFNPLWLSLLGIIPVGILAWILMRQKNDSSKQLPYSEQSPGYFNTGNEQSNFNLKQVSEINNLIEEKVSPLKNKIEKQSEEIDALKQWRTPDAQVIQNLPVQRSRVEQPIQDSARKMPKNVEDNPRHDDHPPATSDKNFLPGDSGYRQTDTDSIVEKTDSIIEKYNSSLDFPSHLVVETVAETTESLGDRRQGQSKTPIMEPDRKGEYWVVRDPDNSVRYYLVPSKNVQLNKHSFETLEALYEYDDNLADIPSAELNIKLVSPATVTPNSGETWKLDEKGRLQS